MASSKLKYSQLSETQLGLLHICLQWLCVQILTLYFKLVYKLKVYGRENCPEKWFPCVVAANHISSLDPPLVSVALNYRPISYMAKIELYEKPLMRLYNWGMSAFAVNREKLELSTVKTALRVLKHGEWALGIFPEGGRRHSTTPEVAETKKGVAYFAKSARVPVLPLGIHHNGKQIRVCIGQLIPSEGQDLDTLSDAIRDSIASLVLEATERNSR
jgi:1-acyl-sn-glycerol-3-phosphate acyltransferase